MRNSILFLFLIVSLTVQSLTLEQRISELSSVPNVLSAIETPNSPREPHPIFTDYTIARITYIYTNSSMGTIDVNTIEVIIDPSNNCWYSRRPSILGNPEIKYITDRTNGGFTESQIKTKIQEVWAQANPSLGSIIGLTVTAVDGKTIRVSGSFDTGPDQEVRTYLLWLVDPNGSVVAGNSNIKWRLER